MERRPIIFLVILIIINSNCHDFRKTTLMVTQKLIATFFLPLWRERTYEGQWHGFISNKVESLWTNHLRHALYNWKLRKYFWFWNMKKLKSFHIFNMFLENIRISTNLWSNKYKIIQNQSEAPCAHSSPWNLETRHEFRVGSFEKCTVLALATLHMLPLPLVWSLPQKCAL